ncbi:MAG: glutamate racemase [Candidatus Omnitrophota bacterium]
MKVKGARPIGIFDSGVGGLTVARSVRRKLPLEDIVYFGDTARVPYGNKSKSTINRFSREIMDFLVKKHVKAVVIACNTASSFSRSFLVRSYVLPVLGVIAPGVRKAVNVSKNKRIGIIGTEATVSSGAYERELLKATGGTFKMFSASCPLFVPLVENKMTYGEITRRAAEKYLIPLKRKGVDTLILGCTHYPMLKRVISDVMKGVTLVDSSEEVAVDLKSLLEEKGLISPKRLRKGKIACYVSDDPVKFKEISGMFLHQDVVVKKAVLE